MNKRYTVRDLMRDLRSGPYTSLGCYPTYFIAADGEALSHQAVRDNVWQVARAVRDGDNKEWQVIGFDVNWEDPNLYCAASGDRIESAYAEKDES
jgi:hypothetical protein